MTSLSTFILFVFGCFIGLIFPDLDTRFRWYPVIIHRSILTHSPLLPLLLWLAFRKSLDRPHRLFVSGLSLALAVHFCFDLAPRSWSGLALIHVPLHGQLSVPFSVICLIVSAIVCLIIGCKMIQNMKDFLLSFFGLIVSYGFCAAHEPRASFGALIALAPMSFLVFVLSRPSNDPNDPGTRLRQLLRQP